MTKRASIGQAESDGSDVQKPKAAAWWQWFFLFPTFGVALLTALPSWVDSARAIFVGAAGQSYQELLDRSKLFARNLDCTGAPYEWNGSGKNRMIDATLCPSGDLFIRVLIPDENSPLAQIVNGMKFSEKSEFVSIDKIVQSASRFSGLSNVFGMAAYASDARQGGPALHRATQGPLLRVQDAFVLVICQKQVNERTLLRHIKANNQCFDETIDTFTGETVSRVPAECRSTCE